MTDSISEQGNSVATSRGDRARSLDSLHDVERRASAAGPRRPDEWRHDLLKALDGLGDSLHEQFATSAGANSLLSSVVEESPHLESSVSELRRRQVALGDRIDELRRELGDHVRDVDVGGVRHEVAQITAEIRELRAWEADLVYEAYSVDLGVGG
jgi:hypothetical protein